MAFKHITSRDNAIFKQLKKIADNKRERSRLGKTLLDGVHLLEAYLQAGGEPELIVIPEGKSSHEAMDILQGLDDVNTLMIPTLMFAELTPVTSSTGILALVSMLEPEMPESVQFALVLEDIQDPGNLGNMLRTALAASVDVVYLSTGCTDAWSPKCLRGGQGAQFYLPIQQGCDVIETLRQFNGNTYATTLSGDTLYQQDLTQPTAFVIGNEGAGLSEQVLAATSHQVHIPMHAKMESLNAATATAICLFERQRQITMRP